MKINPIYRQESRVSARSFRLPLMILLCNSILALVALLDMHLAVSQVKSTAQIQYSSFLSLYIFAAAMEFLMLLLIMPALTSGSISGERERQTLNLLLATPLAPGDIVTGKLLASLSTVFLLIVSSFPVLSLVFIYGGVTWTDIVSLLCCFVSTAMLAGCVGLCSSAVFQRTTAATAASYCIMGFLVFGTILLPRFTSSLMGGEETKQGLDSLLLANPAVTFWMAIKSQAGSLRKTPILELWAQDPDFGPLSRYRLGTGIGIQLFLAAFFWWAAVRRLNPRRRGKERAAGKPAAGKPCGRPGQGDDAANLIADDKNICRLL